mgnify:CR=1 FL=1
MTQPGRIEKNEFANVGIPPSAPKSSDVTDMVKTALNNALKSCAQKMGVTSDETLADWLKMGDSRVHGYFSYALAKQVAECLATLDDQVKAVYLYDYDATPEDVCFGEMKQTPLVHLIVWAQRKTSALNSLVAALDHNLVRNYGDLVQLPQLAHLLDVQVIDDADVKNRSGYGGMLFSLHHRPIQVWKR